MATIKKKVNIKSLALALRAFGTKVEAVKAAAAPAADDAAPAADASDAKEEEAAPAAAAPADVKVEVAALAAAAEQDVAGMDLAPKDYDFGASACYDGLARRITCANEEARRLWARAYGFMINYNHEYAVAQFQACLAADPQCAMAWWGIGYCVSSNYNWEPGLGSSYDALQAAAGLKGSVTALEGDLIDALAARSSLEVKEAADPTKLSMGNDPALNVAYAAAMKTVFEKYANDVDISALYAESLMVLKPWKLWNKTVTDKGEIEITAADDNTLEAVRVIEAGFELEGGKQSPTLCHLYCHIMELSPTPEKALPAADTLRTLMPDCGHLVHMPSHIDAWVGQWKEGIDDNVAGVAADDKFVKQSGMDSMFYKFYRMHNHHFVVWCAMHDGQYTTAMEYSRKAEAQLPAGDKDSGVNFLLSGIIPMGKVFLESYLTMVWHTMVRFGKWDEILAEPTRDDKEVFAGVIATQHYARGVAYASKGMVAEAEAEEVKFLEALKNPNLAGRVLHNNPMYQDPATGPSLLEVSRHILAAEIEYRRQFLTKKEGGAADFGEAFALLRTGVTLSLNLAYNEPWGQMQPVRHILGALLLEQGEVEEAEAVYRADIKLWKNNMWGLLGLKNCLAKKGGADAELAEVSALFTERSCRADEVPTVTCFCAQAKVEAAACCGGEAKEEKGEKEEKAAGGKAADTPAPVADDDDDLAWENDTDEGMFIKYFSLCSVCVQCKSFALTLTLYHYCPHV